MPLNPTSEAAMLERDGDGPADRILARAVLASRLPPEEPWPAWSTGELLAVALVLNRHDILTDMGYTIVRALQRVDFGVVNLLPEIAAEVALERG